jgi:hypothetical protein
MNAWPRSRADARSIHPERARTIRLVLGDDERGAVLD